MKNFSTKFQKFTTVSVSDGVGGFVNTYHQAEELNGGLSCDNSTEMSIADKHTVAPLYTLLAEKGTHLEYGDIVRSVDNGEFYRVINNPCENQTPNITNLNLMVCKLEKWCQKSKKMVYLKRGENHEN